MALVSKLSTKRLEVPNEPGQWVEVRHLRTGDLRRMQASPTLVDLSIDTVASCIVAWSYDVPVTVENVDDQDQDWFVWISNALKSVSGIREEEEKKDSDSSSSPTSEPATATSLASSLT